MHEQVNSPESEKSKAVANTVAQTKSDSEQDLEFVDNRPEAVAQRKLVDMMNKSSRGGNLPIQRQSSESIAPAPSHSESKAGVLSQAKPAQSQIIQRAETPFPLVSSELIKVDLTLTEVMDKVDKYSRQFDQEFQEILGQMDDKGDAITLTVKNLLKRMKSKDIIIPDDLMHIPISQLAAIRAYTEGSYAINQYLMAENPTEGDIKKLEDNREFILNTVIGLSQLPAYKGWVYRGQRVPNALAAGYKAGNVVPFKAFVSTTKSASVLSEFASEDTKTETAMSLKIFSISGRDVSQIAKDPSEQEVLFAPGTEFKVIKNVKVKDKERLEITMIETKAVMKDVPPAPDIAEEASKEKKQKQQQEPKKEDKVEASYMDMILALDKIGKLPKDAKPDEIPILYKLFCT